MAEIAGRPFLEHLLDRLAGQGVRRVTLAVGYRHEEIVTHFGATYHGLDLRYSIETEPLGTGGAVRKALAGESGTPSFVLNADTWLALDMQAMLAAHVAARARVSMAVRHLTDISRFGALEVRHGRVHAFVEKGRHGEGHINAGVYLLEPGIFDGLGLPARFSIETEFLMPQLTSLQPLAFETRGDFIDIGVPEDYTRAQLLFKPRV